MKQALTLFITLSSLVLTGCSGQQMASNPNKYLTKYQLEKPTLAAQSGAIGCIAGALIFNDSTKRNLTLLKCFMGGIAGYTIGKNIDQRRAKYHTKEQRLNGEIHHVQSLNHALSLHLAKQKKELLAYKMKVKMLTSSELEANSNIQTIGKLYQEFNKVEQDEHKSYQQINDEVAFKEQTLQQLKTRSNKASILQQEIHVLKKNIYKLSLHQKQLSSYKKQIANVLF